MPENNATHSLPVKQVARSFSAAAAGYQQVNQLQQTVAERLLDRLELLKTNPDMVLDLGSGPGLSSARLAKYFKKARVIETDISHTMLVHAGRQTPRYFSRRYRVCSNAEMIGIKSDSIGVVYSNLMLQWCNDLDLVMSEIARIIQAGGLFLFSTFGPETLAELRQSWLAVDQGVHVNTFMGMHEIGAALMRAGLEEAVLESEEITVKYDDAKGLMRDLKTLGAHNVNSGRRKTLTGKTRMQNMLVEYEKLRVSGKLPATYEVIYGHAWLPIGERAVRTDKQTVAIPLTTLKKSGR